VTSLIFSFSASFEEDAKFSFSASFEEDAKFQLFKAYLTIFILHVLSV